MNSFSHELIRITNQHLIEESVEKIKQCLSKLNQKEIWSNSHQNQNSVGNLIQHLIGNVTQYIVSGVRGRSDQRERVLEFEVKSNISAEALSKNLDQLMVEVKNVLSQIEDKDLLTKVHVQCFNMSILAIIIHVIEHFSYHTGQIVFFTKKLKNIDTEFYKDMDL